MPKEYDCYIFFKNRILHYWKFWFPIQISKESDIFIENFLPGKLDSLSLGYDVISKINPQIIYCSLTGFGSRGPDKLLPGYDLIASAIGGGMSVTGYEVKYFFSLRNNVMW